MDQQQLSYKEMPLKTECHIDCSPVVLISFMFFQSAFILQLLYGQSQGALSIKQPKMLCKLVSLLVSHNMWGKGAAFWRSVLSTCFSSLYLWVWKINYLSLNL